MIKYSDNEKALIFLSKYDFITSKKFHDICEVLEEPGVLLTEKQNNYDCLKSILKTNYEEVMADLKDFNDKVFYETLDKRGIKCLTIFSENYPAKFLKLANPPYVLYYVGNINLINTQCLAVVGTRNPTNYGKIVTEKIVKPLAENNITIVSGLASGIDKIAHETCLNAKGNTIAVLGGGFDQIYPAMNINLAREIAKNGLILTEHYLNHAPTKYSFPNRNRIIAALSDAILITEAGKKSGSLYTMEYGAEIGIDTYCVPGSIMSEQSSATNDLIKHGGASCVTCAEDLLSVFGITSLKQKTNKKKIQQLTIEESIICSLLTDGEKDFVFLQEKTQYSTQTLNISLTSLEIRGIIKKLAGNAYILC